MNYSIPRVVLQESEKTAATDEDNAKFYADHKTVAPALSPYVIMGYSPRIQLMMLFERSRRALSLGEIHGVVDGTSEEIATEMAFLYELGMLREPRTGMFLLDRESVVAASVSGLMYELRREQDNMTPAEYVRGSIDPPK